MKKVITIIVVICIVAIGLLFTIFSGLSDKLHGTSNRYDTEIGFFDDARKYISSLDLTFDFETADTYTKPFKLNDDKEHSLSVYKNDLNNACEIVVKDSSGNEIIKKHVESGMAKMDLTESNLEGGKYVIEVSLPEDSIGTLGIRVDE